MTTTQIPAPSTTNPTAARWQRLADELSLYLPNVRVDVRQSGGFTSRHITLQVRTQAGRFVGTIDIMDVERRSQWQGWTAWSSDADGFVKTEMPAPSARRGAVSLWVVGTARAMTNS